jgi:cellulose biosynthesis protein BcsQ
MVISILNKKGGVGKTPLALSIAKDLEYFLISNDDSVIEEAYPEYSQIQKEPKLIDNCVYDFGGFVNSDMLHIIEKSNFILLPCDKKIDSKKRTIKTIQEIEKYNKNIFIIATDYKTNKELKEIIEDLGGIISYPILELKHTALYDKIVEYGQSLLEMEKESALVKTNCKSVLNQYKTILSTIKE